MSNNKPNNEPKFNEMQAYEELRMIFVIAIETQNFENLEARISAWEKKYPLEDFVDTEIVRKIKTILNKDFLQRLIGDYLAAQVLHEQEKQKEAYMRLKDIIETAKRTKDYSKAQKQIQSWKNDLYGQELYLANFNKYYKAKICTMLLMPAKEIEKQEEASKALKDLVDRSKDMESDRLSSEISDWQNKYTLDDFPIKLRTELNDITTEVFESISQKSNQENALRELQEIVSSDSLDPLDDIARTLAKYDLSKFDDTTVNEINTLTQEATHLPVLDKSETVEGLDAVLVVTTLSELNAINDLKSILSGNSRNLDGLINWIYINRGINFSEHAREEISKAFYIAGFRIPKQASYSIPEINEHLSYKEFSEIDKIRENVIVNYLGLLSQGEKISSIGSENLSHLNAHRKVSDLAPVQEAEQTDNITFLDKKSVTSPKEFSFSLPVFDNEPSVPENKVIVASTPQEDKSLEVSGAKESRVLQEDDEITIQNIFAEDDLLQDPLETYTLTSEKSNSVEDNSQTAQPALEETVAPEISLPVQGFTKEDKADVVTQFTPQDKNNLSKANELSAYVVVAIPILETIFERKYPAKVTSKTQNSYDYDIQKK